MRDHHEVQPGHYDAGQILTRIPNATQIATTAGEAAIQAVGSGGWASKLLQQMIATNRFIVPLYGIGRATPLTNILRVSYCNVPEAAAAYRVVCQGASTKEVTIPVLAAAAAATATTAFTQRAVGMILTGTNSPQEADLRPIKVQIAGTGITTIDFELYPTAPAFSVAVFFGQNNAGVYELASSADATATIAANEYKTGSTLSSETLNLRDLASSS